MYTGVMHLYWCDASIQVWCLCRCAYTYPHANIGTRLHVNCVFIYAYMDVVCIFSFVSMCCLYAVS